ncbi:hypothetical protein LCL96_17485 [Rossellomorea aquimaris]|uniref:hypothetical protein n=1 Tax=Rossellomorea TaxID=2837508 RepID=UPI001CD58B43|nr:hypothetical protein [Rossellomorea aquimaris]MCA1060733.1 hypothetical protein [Rossellomorea aquimaris]
MTHSKEPFNDVTDHMSKIEGAPMNKPELGSLPLGIRIIGYVLFGFMGIGAICVLILTILY